MRGSRRLGSLAIFVALLALALSAGSAGAVAFAAQASVDPRVQFLMDNSGTEFTFTVHNTGTASGIGAVEIRRPANTWNVVACPMAPAGWSIQTSRRQRAVLVLLLLVAPDAPSTTGVDREATGRDPVDGAGAASGCFEASSFSDSSGVAGFANRYPCISWH